MACLWSKSSIAEKHIYKSLNLEHYIVHSMRIILLHYRCALKINYSDPHFHIQPNES